MDQAVAGMMFGSRLADFVGMAKPPAALERPVRGNFFAATRLVAPPNKTKPLRFPKERAFIFSVQLSDVKRRDLWVEGKHAPQNSLPAGSASFYDLEADIESQVHSGFDSVQFYFPRDAFDEYVAQAGLSKQNIALESGVPLEDNTIQHLAHCILPTLEHPSQHDAPFVDEVALALQAHIVRAYGKSQTRPYLVRGGLAPWQNKRAREKLLADLGAAVSLSEIAADCGLSVGHFARAFRASVGESPHRWLVRQRIERAKAMLADRRARLADVAIDCGFSDQSHFTRMFARETGTPPGLWRRVNQN